MLKKIREWMNQNVKNECENDNKKENVNGGKWNEKRKKENKKKRKK